MFYIISLGDLLSIFRLSFSILYILVIKFLITFNLYLDYFLYRLSNLIITLIFSRSIPVFSLGFIEIHSKLIFLSITIFNTLTRFYISTFLSTNVSNFIKWKFSVRVHYNFQFTQYFNFFEYNVTYIQHI